mgnify:CR=1 FL=1
MEYIRKASLRPCERAGHGVSALGLFPQMQAFGNCVFIDIQVAPHMPE